MISRAELARAADSAQSPSAERPLALTLVWPEMVTRLGSWFTTLATARSSCCARGLGRAEPVSYIERRFRDRGVVVTVVQRKGEIVVLTDSEAAVENARQFDLKVKSAARAHFRAVNVDRALLEEGERAVHDRNVEVQGRQLAAMRAAKALPEPRPHTRSTPLPPGVKAGGIKVIGEH